MDIRTTMSIQDKTIIIIIVIKDQTVLEKIFAEIKRSSKQLLSKDKES